MHDAGCVRFVQRAGNLRRDLQHLIKRQRTLLQAGVERLAFQILHDEERRAVLFADVVERADVRMVELGNRPRFTIEALAELAIGRQRHSQNFDRDSAIEAGVPRLVDLAHASRAEEALDFVHAEARAGAEGHQVRGLYLPTEQAMRLWRLRPGSSRRCRRGRSSRRDSSPDTADGSPRRTRTRAPE